MIHAQQSFVKMIDVMWMCLFQNGFQILQLKSHLDKTFKKKDS